MAKNNRRAAFKTAIITALQAKPELTDVQVSYGYPGDTLEQDSIYTAGCTGEVKINLQQGGRKQRDDLFTLDLVIQSGTHGLTPVESEAAVTALLAPVEDVLADDPSISGLDGIIAVEMSTVSGPNTIRTKEGAMSYFTVTLAVHARYT